MVDSKKREEPAPLSVPSRAPRSLNDIPKAFRKPAKPPGREVPS
jgi:hypothetical protein